MSAARAFAAALVALFSVEACATTAEAGSAPATLGDAGDQNIRALKNALAKAMGLAGVELGAADLDTATTIPVLPPRPARAETKSLARPVLFDLEIEEGACRAIRRDTGERVALPGVRCRAAG